MGDRNKLLSNIRLPNSLCAAWWLRGKVLAFEEKGVGFESSK
jgi:hypothetical protein